MRTSRCIARLVVVLLVGDLSAARAEPLPARAMLKPNFVFVLTDDQSVGTLRGMPHVKEMMAHGTRFTNAIISNPLCCPSRAGILTGLYSHDNGVYTNGDGDRGWGGYTAFVANGDQGRTFAVALRRAGYSTGLFGKYLNHFDGSRQPGWSELHAFAEKNGGYYDYDWSVNGAIRHHGSNADDYSTNLMGREARAWLRSLDPTQPFFMELAPYGPHAGWVAAPRDLGATTRTRFDSPAYNERDVSDKPRYIRRLRRYGTGRRQKFELHWDKTYATLLSVDRWVGRLQDTLAAEGTLDRTYFVFMSDNGVTFGDHRWDYKVVPYERSIRVPMVFTGPGIRRGEVDTVVTNVDLASTFLDLAGVAPMASDGVSLRPLLTRAGSIGRAGVLLEHKASKTRNWVPTYCGMRTKGWMFARYQYPHGTHEQELYNLGADPFEMRNVVRSRSDMARRLKRKMYELGCDTKLVRP